jgi:hypothetical protein
MIPFGSDQFSTVSIPGKVSDMTNKTRADIQPAWKSQLDERKSCRCTVPEAQQSCEVKVGTNILSASLVNESEGGFAVLMHGVGDLRVGRKVQLHTSLGWSTVRVVHIEKVAGPKDAASEGDPCFRLGLKKRGRFF